MKSESGLRIRSALGLAVILVLLLYSASVAWAGGGGGSAEDSARIEADKLIEKVWNVTRANPADPGAVPAWYGAVAGEPLLLRSFSGEPSEYIVPVIDKRGKVISTIGVSAETGKWIWYSFRLRLFHTLPHGKARNGTWPLQKSLRLAERAPGVLQSSRYF